MSALDSIFLSISGISSVFVMPGDTAVLDKRPEGLVLTTSDLLNTVAVKLLPFWPRPKEDCDGREISPRGSERRLEPAEKVTQNCRNHNVEE